MFYQVLWDEDLTIPTQIVPIERNHQLPQHQQSCHQVLHNHEQHPHLVDQGNHHHLVDQGGAEFNSAPARRLSAAFGLDLAPTTAGNKQVLVAYYDTQYKLCIHMGPLKVLRDMRCEGYKVQPLRATNRYWCWYLLGNWSVCEYMRAMNDEVTNWVYMRCERG